MEMTFKQYTENPMGKGSSIFSGREAYKKLYTEKFDKLMLREAGNLFYKLFYNEHKDEYYCYIKIPSESIEKFYYDVVIKFRASEPESKGKQTLDNYFVQFYSDDPAFVYTYLHVFMNKDLFVEELKEKVPKEVKKNDTHTRNPNETVGYVKSLYFAYLFMTSKSLFAKTKYKVYGEKFNKSTFVKMISDMSEKLQTRQDMEKELKKNERLDKKRKKEIDDEYDEDENGNYVPRSKLSARTRSISKTPIIKKITKIKSIKRI